MQKRLVGLMVFFLFLFLLVSPTFAQVVFSDDFSVDLSKWTVVSGSWAIESEELKGETDGSVEGWIYANSDPMKRPITVEFDINFSVTPSDGVGMHGGVMIALSKSGRGSTSGYTVDYIGGAKVYRIYRWDSGVATLLGWFSGYTLNEGQKYHWKIVFDTSITFYVDGGLIGSAIDTTYMSGFYVGLWLYLNGQQAYFDNADFVDAPDNEVPGGVPEFEIGLPIVTSIATAAYMLIRRRLGERKKN